MNGTGDGSDNKGEIKVIVRTLATVLGLCVVGDIVLVYCSKEIPTELWLLTSNCFTALATMLVKTSPTATTTSATEPTPVLVTNVKSDPIPTTETKTERQT